MNRKCLSVVEIGIAVPLLLLTGCATTSYHLTVNTIPTGATIQSQSGQSHGGSPAELYFGNDPKFKSGNCLRVNGVNAVWGSGAQASSDKIINLCGAPGDYTITLSRPRDYPGYESDIAYATQLNLMRLQHEQQIQSQNSDAMNDAASNIGKAIGGAIGRR